MNFNETKFLENAQKIHLKSNEIPIYAAIADADVRAKLDEFVDYGANPRFSAALDEICENLVGRTMFKLLIAKMTKRNQTMRILEHRVEKYGSCYSQNTVYINLNRYELNGSGKAHRQYYGITEEGEVKQKLKSMSGSMFHEFCHALHDISGTLIDCDAHNICVSVELQEVWGEDEEFRTITCHKHDPICDHCFDLMQSILKNKPFLQRCSHNMGYRSSETEKNTGKKNKLSKHFLKYKDLLEGWREYVL
jgi:hypothetical protein